MDEINYEALKVGRKLLVISAILGVVLVLQLYAIYEIVDLNSFADFISNNFVSVLLIVSYLMLTVSMLSIVTEFFKIRKQFDGILSIRSFVEKSTSVPFKMQYDESPFGKEPGELVMVEEAPLDLNDSIEPVPVSIELDSPNGLPEQNLVETLSLETGEEDINTGSYLNTLSDSNYKKLEIKLVDDDGVEIDQELDPEILALLEESNLIEPEETIEEPTVEVPNSEILQTLNELDTVVKELQKRKNLLEDE